MDFTQQELMQLFLSVYVVNNESKRIEEQYGNKFDEIYNEFSQTYDVTDYEKELEETDTKKLLDKLLTEIKVAK